jgi:uncharacterized protein YukE
MTLAALDATIRPVDALNQNGLGWLAPHLQPLQDVVDRMAGRSSAIQTFVDGWQNASTTVEQAQKQLNSSVSGQLADWQGDAGDLYRGRAKEIGDALGEVGVLAKKLSGLATSVGEATASARQSAGDLLTNLVKQVSSYVQQASAAEGGVTANVMSQAVSMVDSYRQPIDDTEQQLRSTIADAERQLNGTTQVAAMGSMPEIGPSVLSGFQKQGETLGRDADGGVTLAQQIIQLPPPRIPDGARLLTKQRLNELANNPIFFGKLGGNVTIGDYAEDAALRALNLTPNDNNTRFYPWADSSDPSARRKFFIPDSVMNNRDTIITLSDKPGIPASTETHVLNNGFMTEVKATGGMITLDEPRQQMQKYIDYLSKIHDDAARTDSDTPTPTLLYVTTADTTLDPSSLAYADSKGVAIWQAHMYETGPGNDPHIAVGPPEARNGVAVQRLGSLVQTPTMTPAPLFNSTYDQLLRRNMIRSEEN